MLVLGMALAQGAAQAAQVVLAENFDQVAAGEVPAGWSRQLRGNGGDVGNLALPSLANWQVTAKPSVGAGDTFFAAAKGNIAFAKSDGIRPKDNMGAFDSLLASQSVAVKPGVLYALAFTNFYRGGGAGTESGRVLVSYDGAAPVLLQAFNGANLSRQNQKETLYFQPPAGAQQAQLVWEYNKAANNWYWGIDEVVLTEDVPPPPVTAPNLNVGPVLMSPGAHGMVVMAETTDAAPTVLYREQGASAFTAFAMVQADKELKDAQIFFAPLAGLKSNTVYEYKLQTGTGVVKKETPLYAFKTWPAPGDVADGHRASFIAFSDTQDNRGGIFKSIVANGIMASERCQAADPVATCVQNLKGVMVGGDFVGSGETRSQWKTQFFDNFGALSPYVPLIPALGNHEFFGSQVQNDSDAEIAKWALTYRKYFAMVPRPSTPTRYAGHYYALDYLDARIFSVGSTPMTAMHNTGNWNVADYDFGRKGFNANYSREVLDWMDASLAEPGRRHLVMVSHQPCLTTTWRQAEAVLVCDLVRKIEHYAEKHDALAATLVGHSHAFDAGNSMNSRHLWFTVASASGALESAKGQDNSDLDIFRNTRIDYGYSELQLQFGSQPRETWRRHSFDAADKPLVVGDDISLSVRANDARPLLAKRNFGGMARDAVQLRLKSVDADQVYESQWQLSRSADFAGEVFDVWGDATRRSNLFFDAAGKSVDTRKEADMLQLDLGRLLAQPQRLYPFTTNAAHKEQLKRITPGGDELGERWQCDRKWDERQCFARLSHGGDKASPLDPFDGRAVPVLALQDGELWYVRARVRDAELNWSGWSDTGRFQVGPVPEVPAQVADLQPGGAAKPSRLSVAPDAVCAGPLQAQGISLPAPKGYALPYGAVDFALTDCAVGVQAVVRAEASGELSPQARLLKYQRGTGQWSEVPGAQRVGNAFEYLLVDGGELDEDGLQNGHLRDPYAIAEPAAEPPVTPPAKATPVPATGWPAALAMALGLLALAWRRARQQV
ncbi:hypothetical protein GCM10027082_44170 [Comamonas humi]